MCTPNDTVRGGKGAMTRTSDLSLRDFRGRRSEVRLTTGDRRL
jgi:hypothetical protein